MADVFLSLGSNMGDRESNIKEAINSLSGTAGIEVVDVSSFYETEALAEDGQADYVNCVVRVDTSLDPHTLLKMTKVIEATLGREPSTHMQPRPIDIDILLYDQINVESMDLMIPHSRMTQRRFVLEPLLEIEPDAIEPVSSRLLKEFLGQTLSQRVNKIKDRSEVWNAP